MKIIENIFSPERCKAIIKDLEGGRWPLTWVSYNDPSFEYRKHTISALEDMPASSRDAIAELHTLCPEGLVPDHNYGPKGFLWGGGVHKTMHGGYLAMHKDCNVLPTSYRDEEQLERVANLIVYLDYVEGGSLLLDGGKAIVPKAGRGVLFDPRDTFHGHPWPLRNRTPRYSLAVYFYRKHKIPRSEWRSTLYQPLPFATVDASLLEAIEQRANPRVRYAKYWPED
jgi:hypothetical protein